MDSRREGGCGGFNSNIIRFTEAYLKAQKDPVSLVLIGNKGNNYFKNLEWPILTYHEGFQDAASIKEVETILRPLIKSYVDKDEPYQCAGSYKYESHGSKLFSDVKGSSFTIQGLALTPLLKALEDLDLYFKK